MVVTDVKVRRIADGGPLKGVASVILDNQLAIHDIKIIYAKEHFFIVMPSRKRPDDTYQDIVHPVNSEFRQHLEEQIIRVFEALPENV